MCGIVGLIHLNGAPVGAADLLAMTDAIRHRGPDDVGTIFGNAATGDYALFGGEDTPADVFGSAVALRANLRGSRPARWAKRPTRSAWRTGGWPSSI